MPRSFRTGELVFDPEVKRTVRTNRKANRWEENLPTLTLSTSNSKSEKEAEVSKNTTKHRTLRELTTLNMNQ